MFTWIKISHSFSAGEMPSMKPRSMTANCVTNKVQNRLREEVSVRFLKITFPYSPLPSIYF
jgi:hypothetical protein